jgi:hypothetical protein
VPELLLVVVTHTHIVLSPLLPTFYIRAPGYCQCPTTATSTNVYAEMKYIVATLYSNYTTSIVDDTGIEQSDSYTAPPKSDKLMIRLDKIAF